MMYLPTKKLTGINNLAWRGWGSSWLNQCHKSFERYSVLLSTAEALNRTAIKESNEKANLYQISNIIFRTKSEEATLLFGGFSQILKVKR